MRKIIVGLCIATVAVTVNANLLINGNFETEGTPAGSSQYWNGESGGDVIGSASWGFQQRVNWVDGWSGGIHDPGYFTVLNGWDGGDAGIWQTVDGVTEGDQYELSGWFKKEWNFAADSYLCKIDWYTSAGAIIGGETAYVDISAINSSTNWTLCQTATLTAPATAARAQVVFEALNMTAGGALVADDLNLAAIPEPTAAALLALGTISLALYRRKQK